MSCLLPLSSCTSLSPARCIIATAPLTVFLAIPVLRLTSQPLLFFPLSFSLPLSLSLWFSFPLSLGLSPSFSRSLGLSVYLSLSLSLPSSLPLLLWLGNESVLMCFACALSRSLVLWFSRQLSLSLAVSLSLSLSLSSFPPLFLWLGHLFLLMFLRSVFLISPTRVHPHSLHLPSSLLQEKKGDRRTT